MCLRLNTSAGATFWLYAEYGRIDVETSYRRLAMKISWSPIINERPFHWTDY